MKENKKTKTQIFNVLKRFNLWRKTKKSKIHRTIINKSSKT